MSSNEGISRRSVLVAALVTPAAWFGPSVAGASDLGSRERMHRLYSKRLSFGSDGEPRVTIGLLCGRRRVRLRCPAGFHLSLSGEDTTVVEAGGDWTVEVGRAQPARLRSAVVLASVPAVDGPAVGARKRYFERLGIEVDLREVGAAFGVRGLSLDGRRVLLTTGRFGDLREATRVARRLARAHGAVGRLHPVVERRVQGTVVGRDRERGVSVRADGVLWFRPRDGRSLVEVAPFEGEGSTGPVRRYRGEIYVALDADGRLAVVNRVRETEVLAGLLPAEIFPSAPFEALCAQAVAARGQLVAKVGTRHLADPFLLCAEEHCQVYAGADREDPRCTRAAQRTRGVVLLRPEQDVLVDTVYSANCGGHTEDNEQVWPGPPDPRLRGRPDPRLAGRFAGGVTEATLAAFLHDPTPAYSRLPGERLERAYRWRAEVDLRDVARRLADRGDSVGRVRGIRVVARGRSGRAVAIRVHGTRRDAEVRGELAIRRVLGGLKSSLFLVEPSESDRERLVLLGGGHGHGVGMCQHGAVGMARDGWSYRKILGHYYGAPRIERLW